MNPLSRFRTIRILLTLLPCLLLAAPADASAPEKAAAPPAAPQGSAANPAPPAAPDSPAQEAEREEDAEDSFGLRIEPRGRGSDKVAILSDVEVPAGEGVPGSVICVGGTARIRGDVGGDVVVVAGKLEMSGTAGGDVAGVLSRLVVEDGAKVGGDLVNAGGALDRGDAQIGGQVVNIGFGKFAAHVPSPLGILGFFLFWLTFLKLLLVFVALLLVAVFVPARVQTISAELPLRPLLAFFSGLGGSVLVAILLFLLIITLIGIPAAILLYFAFLVFKWIGLAGVFHHVGQRIGKGRMSVLGATLLGFLPFALLRFLPFCIGGLIWFTLEMIAIGYVILTRVGKRPGATAASPAPPSAPPVPGPAI